MKKIRTHFTVELILVFLMMAACVWAAVHYYKHDTRLPYTKSAIVWRR